MTLQDVAHWCRLPTSKDCPFDDLHAAMEATASIWRLASLPAQEKHAAGEIWSLLASMHQRWHERPAGSDQGLTSAYRPSAVGNPGSPLNTSSSAHGEAALA
jgi:hypothetical protein